MSIRGHHRQDGARLIRAATVHSLEKAGLGVKDANDGELLSLNGNLFADWIGVAKESFFERLP